MNKHITTMKDLKQRLNRLPDEVLENFAFAQYDDGVGLITTIDESESESMDYWYKMTKKYKSLAEIEHYFSNIVKEVETYTNGDGDCDDIVTSEIVKKRGKK